MSIASQTVMELYQWLNRNQIIHTPDPINSKVVTIPSFGICYLVIGDSGSSLIEERGGDACLSFSEEEWRDIGALSVDINYFIFQFGKNFFYSSRDEKVEFKLLKYVGEHESSEFKIPFLGVHSGYELCSGSRSYSEWCKKAKWLGLKAIGLAEESTFAGAIYFQNACAKARLKPIFGETFKCTINSIVFTIKLYIENQEGYENLLFLNSIVNSNEAQTLFFDELKSNSKGLICVLGKEFDFQFKKQFQRVFKSTHLYYQIDTSEYLSSAKDEEILLNLKEYLLHHKDIEPIWISDAYYLDKEDAHIRKTLNSIGKKGFIYQSRDQYFKIAEVAYAELLEITSDASQELIDELFEKAIMNTEQLVDSIDFEIPTGQKYLPNYIMNTDEAALYSTNEELFYALLEKGFDEKIANKGLDEEIYVARLETEVSVITEGQVLDYFLIIADMVKWAKSQGIMCGLGRGSAAGCLVSYLLGIVGVDPIKYDLLFERFLNAGRLGKSMPDIDQDVQGERREEVKEYLRNKYGKESVAAIGTYGTFKLKSSLKDLARHYGVDLKTTNYVSGAIVDTEGDFSDLMTQAVNSSVLKKYIKDNPLLIEDFLLMLNQPKNTSVHAAGMIIVPKHLPINRQLPIKEMDGLSVAEWEGSITEQVGFLKCDLLGLIQLDKFQEILALIKQNKGIDIDLYNVPLDDPHTYSLFQDGFNEDVFQFGGDGLKSFCKQLKPDNIEDLIATVALYRPGPIEIGFHKKYIDLKNKKEEPTYYWGCEEILQKTYGTLCYQEQVMKICQHVASFTLIEADDIRKAMGKKIPELMESYKTRFIEGAVANECPQEEAERIWLDIEGFSGYAFNRSHAVCYGITGYFSQWLKANYPLEFWTVSLRHSNDKNMANRISEMKKISAIQLVSPDINKSESYFTCDPELNKIYWSITSISQAGDATIEPLFEERRKNGSFFSLEDVCSRIKIRKNAFTNMILCGVLDEIEKVKRPKDRVKVLEKYHTYVKSKDSIDQQIYEWNDFQWEMKQRELCGYGDVGFERFIYDSKKLGSKMNKYMTCDQISSLVEPVDELLAVGIVTEIAISQTKRGEDYAKVVIDDGTKTLQFKLWPDVYNKHREDLNLCKGQVILCTLGAVEFAGNITTQSLKKTIVEFVSLQPKPQESYVSEAFCVKADFKSKITKDKKSTYISFHFEIRELGETIDCVYHHRADSINKELAFIEVNDVLRNFTMLGSEVIISKSTKLEKVNH